MKLWHSAVITAVVATGSVLAYRALAPPVVIVTAAPAPTPHRGLTVGTFDAPPGYRVIRSDGVDVTSPPPPEVDEEPEQADPAPPCVHGGHARTESEAQSLFEEAVSAMRNRDMTEGCCLLDRIVEEAPDGSIWSTKAENLSDRRCDDDEDPAPPAPPAASPPPATSATRRAFEARLRNVLARQCAGGGALIPSYAGLDFSDADAVQALDQRIAAVEADCRR